MINHIIIWQLALGARTAYTHTAHTRFPPHRHHQRLPKNICIRFSLENSTQSNRNQLHALMKADVERTSGAKQARSFYSALSLALAGGFLFFGEGHAGANTLLRCAGSIINYVSRIQWHWLGAQIKTSNYFFVHHSVSASTDVSRVPTSPSGLFFFFFCTRISPGCGEPWTRTNAPCLCRPWTWIGYTLVCILNSTAEFIVFRHNITRKIRKKTSRISNNASNSL